MESKTAIELNAPTGIGIIGFILLYFTGKNNKKVILNNYYTIEGHYESSEMKQQVII